MKEIALVFLVAGISSRFLGRPKGLMKVGPNEESLLEYSIKQAITIKPKKIILVVSKETKPLYEKEFGIKFQGIPIEYAIQEYDKSKRDRPWGTIDAVCSAQEFLDCPFIECNGDDIYGEETFQILANHLREKDTNATVGYKLGLVIPERGGVNRGVYKLDGQKIISIEETFDIEKEKLSEKSLTPETLCSMNIFALTPSTLKIIKESLEEFKSKNQDDRKIECLLPTEINSLIKQEKMTLNIYPTNSNWFGITNPGDELIVRQQIKK